MVLERSLFQTFVQGRFAAVEIRQLVTGRDWSRRGEMERLYFSQGALVLSRRRSLSVGGNG